MKNKYFVISAQGEIFDPNQFYKRENVDEEFKILLLKEADLEEEISKKAFEELEEFNKKNSEIKKLSYLEIAKKFGFAWEENSSIGFMQYNFKAMLMMNLLMNYSRELVNQIDIPIFEVKGSNFFNLSYPVVQAYAGLFGDRLFKQSLDNQEFVMSYDASYPQFNIASKSIIKDSMMPFAHFSISDCFRNEQKGECMLMYRLKRFFMPDIHPYLRNVNEAFEYFVKIEKQIEKSIVGLDRKYWNIVKVGSEKFWLEYKDKIVEIAKRRGQELLVEIRQDNIDRYWIIDVDYSIVDSFNQVREIACIQIDIGNAQRLDIKYIDQDGFEKNPVIIHAAVPGGIERYFYMLFDGGMSKFPFWLYPVQLRILPVNQSFVSHIEKVLQDYSNLRLRIEIDDRPFSISKKIKLAYNDLVPEVLVFGEKEAASPEEFLKKLNELSCKNVGFPFEDIRWPKLLSRQLIS